MVTREEWLQSALRVLQAELLPELDKDVLVSVGWPGGRGNKDNTIGQCWHQPRDKPDHIFISPVLTDTGEVLSTLLHEAIHVVCGEGVGHAGEFITLAKRVGFMAPWKSTPESETLKEILADFAKDLGKFPHQGLSPMPKSIKQSTRMVKCLCSKCGWTCRTSRKWIDLGLPTCYCGTELEEAL